MRKIGFVTGTRADFGLLYQTIKKLQRDKDVEVVVYACGTHLSPEYGLTINEIRALGIKNIVSVEMLLSSSTRVGVVKSMGLALISLSEKFSADALDCLVILGDRFEALAAAQTAMILDIPIAHIHGGEITEGAFDDAIRHSITKMAAIHFTAAEQFSKRVIQLGEDPNQVHVVGAPGIDNIMNERRMSLSELESSLNCRLNKPTCLVTYHPVTKGDCTENDITPLAAAIEKLSDYQFIITYPNADGGGDVIIEQWQTLKHLPNVHLINSLGFIRYLSIMEHVFAVVGNSSSGIIEAPAMGVPTVNIGSRQHGRPQSISTLNVEMDTVDLSKAIVRSFELKENPPSGFYDSPYRSGNVSDKIVQVLKTSEFSDLKIKTFRDVL